MKKKYLSIAFVFTFFPLADLSASIIAEVSYEKVFFSGYIFSEGDIMFVNKCNIEDYDCAIANLSYAYSMLNTGNIDNDIVSVFSLKKAVHFFRAKRNYCPLLLDFVYLELIKNSAISNKGKQDDQFKESLEWIKGRGEAYFNKDIKECGILPENYDYYLKLELKSHCGFFKCKGNLE